MVDNALYNEKLRGQSPYKEKGIKSACQIIRDRECFHTSLAVLMSSSSSESMESTKRNDIN